jgi:hypothetical protein
MWTYCKLSLQTQILSVTEHIICLFAQHFGLLATIL